MSIRTIYLIFFVVIFLCKVGESLLPYDHPDALYYHLTGARIWFESSWNDIWLHLTGYAQAGYFDVIYYLLFFITNSLLKIQVLGQFLHFFFSLGVGSLFIFWRVGGGIWGILGGISLLTIARDSSFFLYAKNDGVLAFLSLMTAYLVISRKNLNLIAVFLGLMMGIKISAIMVIIPLSCILLFDYRKELTKLTKPFLICLLVLSPKLLENYIYTGTIFFPALLRTFPGSLTPAMLRHYTFYFGSPVSAELIKTLLADYFLGKVLFLIALPLFFVNWKNKNHRLNLYYGVALSVFMLYLFFNGGYQAARFFFSSYFLTTYFIFLSLRELDIKTRWFSMAILILILCDSKLDRSFKHGSNAIREFYTLSEKEIVGRHIPEVEFWEHLDSTNKTQLILTDYTAPSFYLPNGYRMHQTDHNLEANFIFDCKDPQDVKKIDNYRYALLSVYGLMQTNPCYKHLRENTKLIFSRSHFRLYKLF